jgi:ribonuclease HII
VVAPPTLRRERELLRSGARRVAGVDEVGRGAIAGPVTVGVSVVDLQTPTAPTGLRDSKLLSAEQRNRLEPRIRSWARSTGVGHASAEEIDRHGIIAALRLAALRALAECGDVDVAILDGNHDWLTAPQSGLFGEPPWPTVAVPRVLTAVKADQRCSSVAAASVAAKVARDRLMVGLDNECPGYGWTGNKGYSTADHSAALRSLGASAFHRRSWRLAALAEAESGGAAVPSPPPAHMIPT